MCASFTREERAILIAMVSAELKELFDQRDALDAALELTPGDADLLAVKAELEELIAGLEAEEAPAQPPPPPVEQDAPKWDKAKHPAFAKQAQQTGIEEPAPVVFKQGDTVLAKWTKDRQFYEARITSITGSSADPVYFVKYLKYDEQAQLRRQDLKAIYQSSKKRKADDSPAPPAVPSAPSTPIPTNIIAAPSTVNPELAAQAKEGSKYDAQNRPAKTLRQMPKSKALNTKKNSWQDFQKKGGKKTGKKESMFRTQEGNPNARGENMSISIHERTGLTFHSWFHGFRT